jgi:hypothetical protein
MHHLSPGEKREKNRGLSQRSRHPMGVPVEKMHAPAHARLERAQERPYNSKKKKLCGVSTIFLKKRE